MAFGRGKAIEPIASNSLIASAVRLGLSEDAWKGYRFTDEAWQKAAWDFYDTIPQLHQSVEYIGAAASMVRIFVAEVDENGIRQGEVFEDPEIASLADNLFGGPANKAEMLRAIAESLTVAGEVFILGKAARGSMGDMWWTAAPSEVRRQGSIVYVNMGRATREELNPGSDLIIRAWTPHPRRFYLADSPVRGLLGLLQEMADMQLFIRGQLNSRIANAVVWLVPSELSVPRGDDDPVTIDDIYEQFNEVVTSNLEGRGTAAQFAPIIFQLPTSSLEAMKGNDPIRFESPLSEQAIELRKEQQEKLAIGMNVPVEIQVGGREMNHWSIWWAGEEFIIKTVQPMFNRIVDALTTAYLIPALKKMGRDISRFTYWYDTAPLANSANKLDDTLNLYRERIVGKEVVRREGNFNDADAMSEDEQDQLFMRELMLRDPTLFNIKEAREAAGLDIDIEAAPMGVPEMGTPPPPPPAPETLPTGPQPGELPDRPSGTDDGAASQLIASVVATSPILAASNAAVLRALELAGKRMLTPTHRKMFPNADVVSFHTKVKVASPEHADTLLAGAWDYLDGQLEGTGYSRRIMTPVLGQYTKGLLLNNVEHSRSLLAARLDSLGIR